MAEQGVVVAIRLSDVHECDQPDPLCLRAEDLSKWRHLEVLLRNMYRDPPQAIKVTYLDNEDDWVQISCDEELAEAVRITQRSDNILLFQVKRLDPLITFENQRPANQAPAIKAQPDGTPLRSIASQPLVYPHPSGPPAPITAGSRQEPFTPLIYPHPTVPSAPVKDDIHAGLGGNVLPCSASGKMASFESKPDSSSGEKFARLMTSPESIGANRSAQGLNSLSSGSVWERAASLPSAEKLKFLTGLIPRQGQQEGQSSSSTTGESAAHRQEQISGQDLLVEPLCPENGSLGKNTLANQDPFESMSSGHPSNGLEQAQLLQPTLTPLKACQSETAKAQNIALEIETDGPKSGCTENFQDAVRPALCLVSRSSHQPQPLSAEKGRIGKGLVTPPVPLPRTLQMMEGAQSGANAVAIEIPESYHGAAHKEEDVTASGGASCTSASAETGEGVPDGSHHAAAFGREVKSTADPSAVSAITRDSRMVAAQISTSQMKKKSSVKKKSDSGKSENSGAKRKENGGKEYSTKKRPSAEKNKKDNIPVKKEDKKVKADVESGEKTVSQVPVKDEVSSQYKDIVKYMRRMKKELHSNIVKDVTKQTDKLMKKNFERSMSCDSSFLREDMDRHRDVCHSGVYCDSCNCVIYGIRYKCGNCPDYDLCAKCEALPNVHDLTHVFLKLRRPASTVGVEVPLLRESIYLCDSQLESNSEDNAEGFSRLSQKSSDDAPDSPKSNANDQELEIFKWYWDSFGTGHSEAMMDIESMPKLSKTEMKKVFQMLNSQEEAEDFPFPKESPFDVGKSCETSEVPCLSLPSVDEDEEDQPTEQQQAREAIPIPVENEQCEELEMADVKATDLSLVDRESTSDYQEIDNEEGQEEQEDQYDENFNVAEHRNASVEDSDSSDDFCVIDPPSREEFEACGMEFSTHSEVWMPLVNAYPAEEKIANPPLVFETDCAEARSPSFCTIVKAESILPSSEEEVIQESMEEDRCQVQQCPSATEENVVSGSIESSGTLVKEIAAPQQVNQELAALSESSVPVVPDEGVQKMEEDGIEMAASPHDEKCGADAIDEDYLLKMTANERREFLTTVEALKEKARLLEQQLKEQKGSEASQVIECQKEKEVQLILKAKRKEAMRENEKLERMNMKQVAEKLEKWQSFQDKRQREEKIKLQEEKEQMYQAHRQAVNTNVEESEPQTNEPTSDAATSSSLHFGGHGNVVYVQTKKDANCQTHSNVDPATQASQMFQQITHGVSKAATTAFWTAKDVIYSLQAKQYEKKATTHNQKPMQPQAPSVCDDTWTPPASVWTPPKDEYVPPKSEWTPTKSDWTPPKSEWTPPKDEFVPPKSDWTPPKSEWTPPSDEKKPTSPNSCPSREDNSRPQSSRQQKKEAGRHSQDSPLSPTASISSIPMADLTLHEERKSMQRLQEMGFANREQNRKLLQQFDGDLEKVVQSLLQEEGGEHWACYRH